jgi:hypothetical protein
MPYQLSWAVPKRVIWQRLYGEVTLEEVVESLPRYLEMLEDGGDYVHTLVDLTLVRKYPSNIPQITKTLDFRLLDRQGWVVMIQSMNPLIKFIASATAQILLKNARIRILPDLATAIEFLQDQGVTFDAGFDFLQEMEQEVTS